MAEVNLKFIWDVVSRIKIGEKGQAYVIDSHGHLVAHPDISLVLQKIRSVSAAAGQGGAARQDATSRARQHRAQLPGGGCSPPTRASSRSGWHVFVEQPIEEASRRCTVAETHRHPAARRPGAVGAGEPALARQMVGRSALHGAPHRIGAGNLDQKIEVHTGDELEALAEQFNTMAGQAEGILCRPGAQGRGAHAELRKTLEQQTATSEILSVISSSPTDVQPVFDTIADRAARLCDAKFGFVFTFDGELIHLRQTSGSVLQRSEPVAGQFQRAGAATSIAGRRAQGGDVPRSRRDGGYWSTR